MYAKTFQLFRWQCIWDSWKIQTFSPRILFQLVLVSLSSSTILFFVFWSASCKTFDVFSEMRISFDNFSFCFTKRSNLEVISSSFWFISLFCSRRSCCYTRMFSCNAKNDGMMFLLLIFFQLSSGKNFPCHDCAMITPPWLQ